MNKQRSPHLLDFNENDLLYCLHSRSLSARYMKEHLSAEFRENKVGNQRLDTLLSKRKLNVKQGQKSKSDKDTESDELEVQEKKTHL